MSPTVTTLHPVVPIASVQGTLALDLPDTAHPSSPGVEPGCDLVEVDPLVRHRLVQWAGRFCQSACDVAVGARPASQLVRWTSPKVYAEISRRARRHTTAVHPRRQMRPRVATVRPSFVSADAVEVSFRVAEGQHYRAVAARFETHRGHWQCVALQVS